MLSTYYVILLTVMAAAIVAYAQYVFKKSVPKFKFNLSGALSLAKNRMVVAGVLIYMLGLVFYLFAHGAEAHDVRIEYLHQLFYVVTVLKETVGLERWVGVVVISIGTALIGLS